jgi:rhodanese-related sulfurtransferase
MKLKTLLIAGMITSTSLLANSFVDYKTMSSKLVAENKKAGNYATIEQVKAAINSKDWVVADVRTNIEWAAGRIKGSVRVGRQAPEKAIANHVLDDDDNFVKQNIIVVCNSAKRASIEAQTFKLMGFKNVKIFDFYSWVDSCNPIVTNYSSKKNKAGTKNKFGQVKAAHCYK